MGKRVHVTQCVLSHWHHDHVGGVSELRRVCAEAQGSGSDEGRKDAMKDELKIYKYPLVDSPTHGTSLNHNAAEKERQREKQLLRTANDDQDVGSIIPLHDKQILEVGDPHSPDEEKLELQILHTPGHTSDHIVLVINSSPADPSEVGTIFTGDAVLGHGTAVFEDLAQYMKSLQKMKEAIEKITTSENLVRVTALPGHGAVIADAKSKIEEYITHRAMREKEVLDLLAAGSATTQSHNVEDGRREDVQWWTPMEIVKVVYKDVPESLHIAAQGGVVQVLKKLEGEGKVEKMENEGKWRTSQKHQQTATNILMSEERKSTL